MSSGIRGEAGCRAEAYADFAETTGTAGSQRCEETGEEESLERRGGTKRRRSFWARGSAYGGCLAVDGGQRTRSSSPGSSSQRERALQRRPTRCQQKVVVASSFSAPLACSFCWVAVQATTHTMSTTRPLVSALSRAVVRPSISIPRPSAARLLKRGLATVQSGNAHPVRVHGGLRDQDRIFTNAYRQGDHGIKGAMVRRQSNSSSSRVSGGRKRAGRQSGALLLRRR